MRVCVCVPVRELEIEPCNKCCAFPDRIAETNFFHISSAKENRTDVPPNASFLRGVINIMHLLNIILLLMIKK